MNRSLVILLGALVLGCALFGGSYAVEPARLREVHVQIRQRP